MKLNNSENYEYLMTVTLTKEDYPIAFANKVQEMMEQNLFNSVEEAEKAVSEMDIELELYYHKDYGLFAVESEAVENNIDIFSPYTGELCERDED
jgi:hypothetical protein